MRRPGHPLPLPPNKVEITLPDPGKGELPTPFFLPPLPPSIDPPQPGNKNDSFPTKLFPTTSPPPIFHPPAKKKKASPPPATAPSHPSPPPTPLPNSHSLHPPPPPKKCPQDNTSLSVSHLFPFFQRVPPPSLTQTKRSFPLCPQADSIPFSPKRFNQGSSPPPDFMEKSSYVDELLRPTFH